MPVGVAEESEPKRKEARVFQSVFRVRPLPTRRQFVLSYREQLAFANELVRKRRA